MDSAASDIATLLHVLTEKVDDLDTKLNDVVSKVDSLAAQLNGIGAQLNGMAAQLNDLVAAHASTTEGVSRMTGHIDFVEGVYDTLRHPLSRLTGLVRRQELPAPPGSQPPGAQ